MSRREFESTCSSVFEVVERTVSHTLQQWKTFKNKNKNNDENKSTEKVISPSYPDVFLFLFFINDVLNVPIPILIPIHPFSLPLCFFLFSHLLTSHLSSLYSSPLLSSPFLSSLLISFSLLSSPNSQINKDNQTQQNYQINEVVLVGGSSRSLPVRDAVRRALVSEGFIAYSAQSITQPSSSSSSTQESNLLSSFSDVFSSSSSSSNALVTATDSNSATATGSSSGSNGSDSGNGNSIGNDNSVGLQRTSKLVRSATGSGSGSAFQVQTSTTAPSASYDTTGEFCTSVDADHAVAQGLAIRAGILMGVRHRP